jgi:hypothetical protein
MMSSSSNTMKKQEKMASSGQQETFELDTQVGMDHELSKGAETETGGRSNRLPSGERDSNVNY